VAAVHSREFGGDGVPYNALLREGRPRISDHIFEGPRKNKSPTKEANKEGSFEKKRRPKRTKIYVKERVTYFFKNKKR